MDVAVITGAASGIGAGLAREAIARGMRVVLADHDAQNLDRITQELGVNALAVPTDVTQAASMENLAEQTYRRFGQVDMLFNNAGVLSTGRSWEISDDKWQQAWQVNVNGIIHGLRAFVPRLLQANRAARIINTSSVGGFLPSPLMAPYSATKFAVVALTEALSGELAALNPAIQVSLLAPGPVKTGIFNEAPMDASQDFHQQMRNMLDAHGLDSATFAHRVFDAIAEGAYWIIPQPETLDPLLQARNTRIAQRQPPVFAWSQESTAA